MRRLVRDIVECLLKVRFWNIEVSINIDLRMFSREYYEIRVEPFAYRINLFTGRRVEIDYQDPILMTNLYSQVYTTRPPSYLDIRNEVAKFLAQLYGFPLWKAKILTNKIMEQLVEYFGE